MLSYHVLISDKYGYANRLEELDYHVFIHLERNLSLIQSYGAKIVKIIQLCKLSPLYLIFLR